MEDGNSVDVQRQRRHLPAKGTARDSHGNVSRGPDDCRHYPDCSRLERLLADPGSGRVPYPYPVMPSQYVVAVNTSSPSMRDKQWKNTLCRGIGILFLACYLSYLLD